MQATIELEALFLAATCPTALSRSSITGRMSDQAGSSPTPACGPSFDAIYAPGKGERKKRMDTMNTSNTSSNSDPAASQSDLFSLLGGGNAELLENPFPMFALMRSMGAVFPIPFPIAGMESGAWVVTRMQEAVQVLKDHARFTVDTSSIGLDGPFAQYTDSSFLAKTMISVDDPDHRRLRGLVSKVFTPRYI